jgi:hypothetical protein
VLDVWTSLLARRHRSTLLRISFGRPSLH